MKAELNKEQSKEKTWWVKTQTWFEVIQVVKRDSETGRLTEWYPGDKKHQGLGTAIEEKKQNTKDFPGTEYKVLEVTIKEL